MGNELLAGPGPRSTPAQGRPCPGAASCPGPRCRGREGCSERRAARAESLLLLLLRVASMDDLSRHAAPACFAASFQAFLLPPAGAADIPGGALSTNQPLGPPLSVGTPRSPRGPPRPPGAGGHPRPQTAPRRVHRGHARASTQTTACRHPPPVPPSVPGVHP